MKTKLILPMSPSVNQLYATNWKTKLRFKTKHYKKWIEEAGWEINQQRPQRHTGKVAVTFFAKQPTANSDIDNRWKALNDLLVTMRVIKDDKYISVLHSAWDEAMAPGTMKVVVEDVA